MKNNVFAFFAGSVFLLAMPPVWAQPSMQQQKDSLRNLIDTAKGNEKLGAYKHLASYYMREVRNEGVIDTLLAIYDEWDAEAGRQSDVDGQAAARTNKLVVLAGKGAALYAMSRIYNAQRRFADRERGRKGWIRNLAHPSTAFL